MSDRTAGHRWQPITDLSDRDRAAASDEMPALAQTWEDVRQHLDPSQVADFNERLKREWAIETGIIERLYTLDQGTTRLLIEHGIDASLISHDASDQPSQLVADLVRDQAEAVDWLFDLVAQQRPLSTSFVKELHELMTRKQKYATGIDPLGRKCEVPLLHGAFKVQPNNPVRPDGKVHEYCPPEHVDAEMDRLLDMHRAHLADDTAPDVSSAWLHHRFAQIHPFQDGNGRVARAISSLVLIQAEWFPLVVTRRHRAQYLDALGSADRGDLTPLTHLIATLERRWFLKALAIAEDIRQETRVLGEMLDAISDKFSGKRREADRRYRRAKDTAQALWDHASDHLSDVADQLDIRIGNSHRKAWSDYGEDDQERRWWNRLQVVKTARYFDYFANIKDYHDWTRLAIDTEMGRSEILVSFHTIGREFRGVIAVSICFYRRQSQGTDMETGSPIADWQAISDDIFQINFSEAAESAETRFRRWLNPSIVQALDVWRRGE